MQNIHGSDLYRAVHKDRNLWKHPMSAYSHPVGCQYLLKLVGITNLANGRADW